MQVIWHGLNCIRLEGKDVNIVLDPFSDDSGLKLSRAKADIVTLSADEGLDADAVGGEPFVIELPGEYEIKGAFIYGVPWKKEKGQGSGVLYRVNFEDISFGHIAALDRVVPNAALETLEGVDVLFLPVGDPKQLSPKDAAEIVSRIEPRVVVPMNYAMKGLKSDLQGAEAFIKELGMKAESVDKLKLIKKDLPADDRRVYLINPS
jgi:L-ascorbate metabolism protein UlaG (beta-lactamase superfamily)